jgi:hypothetical protein
MSKETAEENAARLAVMHILNERAWEREQLEKEYGQVWDTEQLQDDFEVLSFMAPMALVRRKSDGKMGGILFQHLPRYYFFFNPDEG